MVSPRLDPITIEFDAFVAAIADVQAEHIKAEGKRYLQVLASTAKVPTDDKAELCDWRKPDDRETNIKDTAAVLPTSSRCQFEVHEYLGPHGLGYIVLGHVMVDGIEYVKAHHVGSDPAHQSFDWREVVKQDLGAATRTG